jgi:hypothetical protein
MDSGTLYLFFGGIAVVLICMFWMLFRLLRASSKLKRDYAELASAFARQQSDLGGLCAAGVNIDRLLMDHAQRIRQCGERIESLPAEKAAHSYYAAIERIRNGAQAQDLVAECGLTLSEASLLARLHGSLGRYSEDRGVS